MTCNRSLLDCVGVFIFSFSWLVREATQRRETLLWRSCDVLLIDTVLLLLVPRYLYCLFLLCHVDREQRTRDVVERSCVQSAVFFWLFVWRLTGQLGVPLLRDSYCEFCYELFFTWFKYITRCSCYPNEQVPYFMYYGWRVEYFCVSLAVGRWFLVHFSGCYCK